MIVSGWVHRHQLIIIEFLQAENRLLKERLRGKRFAHCGSVDGQGTGDPLPAIHDQSCRPRRSRSRRDGKTARGMDAANWAQPYRR